MKINDITPGLEEELHDFGQAMKAMPDQMRWDAAFLTITDALTEVGKPTYIQAGEHFTHGIQAALLHPEWAAYWLQKAHNPECPAINLYISMLPIEHHEEEPSA